MVDWFLHPEFLAAAAALVSVPIIIHLINRMRYKRIRWAAMEFLLKAQKRMRRRLIIEQLLLLALRCLLVAMTGLLVMRFLGFSFSDAASKQGIHIVLIDDTLSMNDGEDRNGKMVTSFDVATNEIVLKSIVKAIASANASDKLILMTVTGAATDPDYQGKTYDRLSTESRSKELEADLKALQPTKMHASVQQAVKRVQDLVNNTPDSRITLHIVGDFRQRDWARPDAENLHQMLHAMVSRSRDFKLFLFDVAFERWEKGRGNPLAHDNLGILDFRAGTRVAGKGMPVSFTATLANFSGREAEVKLVVTDEIRGPQLVVKPPLLPVKISPASTTTVTFEVDFNPQIKPNEAAYEQISVRMLSPTLGELPNDGLADDNVRYAAVEVRDRVPILVIDGEGSRGRTDVGRDSFHLQWALMSVPGDSYDIVWGDELGGGVAAKALERVDLGKFPTIFMMNVRELSPKQLANLESYVRDGGGVCFFMGPQVSPKYYNQHLYKDGAGLFPVPLADTYFPPPNDEPRVVEVTGYPQVLLREDQFGDLSRYPIFGAVFDKDSKQKTMLNDLPIRRYFQVPRGKWKYEPGKVFELATLPNDAPIANFGPALRELIFTRLDKAMEGEEMKQYRTGIERHRRNLDALVAPGSEKLAYHLAPAIDAFLNDKGDPKNKTEFPNLTHFWQSPDAKVGSLREELIRLRDQLRYGDPLVVAGQFGKGKVVAVMTTAGKEWNDWAGGSGATLLFPPFILEMQNYISSQSGDDNLTVGTTDHLTIDSEPYKGKQLKAQRSYLKSVPGKAAEVIRQGDTFPREGKGQLIFDFPRSDLPGLYVTSVRPEDSTTGRPLVSTGRVFNVDTAREGNLGRVSREEIEKNVVGDHKEQIRFQGPGVNESELVDRASDLSESPWLYLIFLLVLVCEQALAVHLSFHLKGDEQQVLRQVARGS